MARYGTDIEVLAQYLDLHRRPTNDPSLEAVVFLALAYAAMQRLGNRGADLTFQGRPLIFPWLERAYREMLHVRSRLTADWLDDSLITRFGRLVDASKVQDLLDGSVIRGTDPEPGDTQGPGEPG